MNKETWIKHLEETESLIRPSISSDKLSWHNAQKRHLENKCPECLSRLATFRANKQAKEKREVMSSLGLVRVKGNLGGIYYE